MVNLYIVWKDSSRTGITLVMKNMDIYISITTEKAQKKTSLDKNDKGEFKVRLQLDTTANFQELGETLASKVIWRHVELERHFSVSH